MTFLVTATRIIAMVTFPSQAVASLCSGLIGFLAASHSRKRFENAESLHPAIHWYPAVLISSLYLLTILIEAEKNKSPMLSVRKSEYLRVLESIASSQPTNLVYRADGEGQAQSQRGRPGRRRKRDSFVQLMERCVEECVAFILTLEHLT